MKPLTQLPGTYRADNLGAAASSLRHMISGELLLPPFAADSAVAMFAMGCFWGAERLFWRQHGVCLTAVGYAGGDSPEPDYTQVCSGDSGHAEVVLVVFQPELIAYRELLRLFWENHDPTQGMRQGNDIGSQYRSLIFAADSEQLQLAHSSRDRYQTLLAAAPRSETALITTDILPWPTFHYAEPYHQQYLARNPLGYCGLRHASQCGRPRLSDDF